VCFVSGSVSLLRHRPACAVRGAKAVRHCARDVSQSGESSAVSGSRQRDLYLRPNCAR